MRCPISSSSAVAATLYIGDAFRFRPEMLEPMGLPKDVSVIAWGISLERPTMIYYGVDNIRDLFGCKRNFTHTAVN